MKNKQIYLVLFTIVFHLMSCIDGHPIWEFSGGEDGNIKMYSIVKKKYYLNLCFDELYDKRIIFKPDSLSIYKDDALSKIALFTVNRDTFAFYYEIARELGDTNKSILTLTHFGKNGENLFKDEDLTKEQKKILLQYFDSAVFPSLELCK